MMACNKPLAFGIVLMYVYDLLISLSGQCAGQHTGLLHRNVSSEILKACYTLTIITSSVLWAFFWRKYWSQICTFTSNKVLFPRHSPGMQGKKQAEKEFYVTFSKFSWSSNVLCILNRTTEKAHSFFRSYLDKSANLNWQ